MTPAAGVDRTVRRRGDAVVHDVLEATLSLLGERGYGFTVEDVAAAAGVNKTSVYRRWATKPVLVAAALQVLAARDVPDVRSGDPLADLETLVVRVARALRRPAGGNALRAAVSASGSDPELQASTAAFLTSRYTVATSLIEDAQAGGALRPELDPTLVWQAVVNPLHLNAVTGGRLDDNTARSLLDLVLRGAQAAAPTADTAAPSPTAR